MPSFEPNFFRTTLTHLEEERENTQHSKSTYEELWEILFAQWSDHAGRQVNSRNMTPLIEVYSQALTQGQQFVETSQKCAELYDRLRGLLVDSAHHQEQYERLFVEANAKGDERDKSLRSSETLTAQVEEQQKHIAAKKAAAGRHVGLL
jgi:ABC-type transporter Mla subunit MlaD